MDVPAKGFPVFCDTVGCRRWRNLGDIFESRHGNMKIYGGDLEIHLAESGRRERYG
jgi:hypothetical protein